jgi:hypothetical protein
LSLNCLPVGHRLTPHWRFTPGRSVSALSVIPGPGARFSNQVANYSAGGDIAADLISEPSRGTNLDIAATDQIRPIATTMAIAMDVLRMCIPLCLR